MRQHGLLSFLGRSAGHVSYPLFSNNSYFIIIGPEFGPVSRIVSVPSGKNSASEVFSRPVFAIVAAGSGRFVKLHGGCKVGLEMLLWSWESGPRGPLGGGVRFSEGCRGTWVRCTARLKGSSEVPLVCTCLTLHCSVLLKPTANRAATGGGRGWVAGARFYLPNFCSSELFVL